MLAVARAAACLLAIFACSSAGCRPKASATQCDQLLDRYAQLVVTERFPDASAEQIGSERDREKREARGDDAFKNCSSEVSQAEFACAMRALNADAFEKCLE
ncbi:MAG TPA: hypothetical protein VN894_08655 [Polyangiaceae bacterium]|nr:hypothetical protein [Polyangiaceae bacterium]